MNLIKELNDFKEKSEASKSEEVRKIMKGEIERIKKENIIKSSLKEGDYIKAFSLINPVGNIINSENLLKKGPIVINFYRGGWCPYCNLELRAYMEVLEEIKSLGANLIAISPEIPDQSLNTIEKNQLEFLVLSDIDNKVAKEFGLVFKISNELNELYKSFGIDLEKSQGRKSLELPMAATYVVNKEGKIIKAFVKEDYKERLDPKIVLESLRNL